MAPTSIDGTDVSGITIDGTEVQEITQDGDVVFTGLATNRLFTTHQSYNDITDNPGVVAETDKSDLSVLQTQTSDTPSSTGRCLGVDSDTSGNIFASFDDGEVYKIDTSDFSVLQNSQDLIGSSDNGDYTGQIVYGPNDKVYVMIGHSSGESEIVKLNGSDLSIDDRTGTFSDLHFNSFGPTTEMMYAEDDYIYAASATGPGLQKFDPSDMSRVNTAFDGTVGLGVSVDRNGFVYISMDDGTLRKVNRSDLTEDSQVGISGSTNNSSVIYSGGELFVSKNNFIHRVDPDTMSIQTDYDVSNDGDYGSSTEIQGVLHEPGSDEIFWSTYADNGTIFKTDLNLNITQKSGTLSDYSYQMNFESPRINAVGGLDL